MATKNRAPTTETVRRWIRLGYGQGCGSTYKPFVYVRDVPSRGASSMVLSRITQRAHHYLSAGEYSVHLLAEHCPHTIDIREQYALLPWEETQWSAKRPGIRHPIVPTTRTPSVLTTDLLLSLKEPDGTKLIAISVKPTKNLTARALEKLLLERLYWNRRGIDWVLATDGNIPRIRTMNLRFFEDSLRNHRMEDSTISPERFNQGFEAAWTAKRTYIQTLRLASDSLGIDPNTGHRLLGASVWQRLSRIDLDHSILAHNLPVVLVAGGPKDGARNKSL